MWTHPSLCARWTLVAVLAILQSRFRIDLIGQFAWFAFEHRLAKYVCAILSSDATAAYRNTLGPAGDFPLLRFGSEGFVGAAASDAEGVASSSSYEHLEYEPLVNARAFQLGDKRQILNSSADRQYRALLWSLCHKPARTANDTLAIVYHLLLQERVDEARALFTSLPPPPGSKTVADSAAASDAGAGVTWTVMQYDYIAAYLAFYAGDDASLAVAQRVADSYAQLPLAQWKPKFEAVAAQLAEYRGDDAATGAADSASSPGATKDDRMHAGAKTEPSLSVSIDGGDIVIECVTRSCCVWLCVPVCLCCCLCLSPHLVLTRVCLSGTPTSPR